MVVHEFRLKRVRIYRPLIGAWQDGDSDDGGNGGSSDSAVVVVVEKRPGGPRGLQTSPERVEGPKSTVLSLSRTPGGILTLERRPHEPREFVCKGTIVLVPRRVAPLPFSLPLLLALLLPISFLRLLFPPTIAPPSTTTFLHSPFPHWCSHYYITNSSLA